ncbi:MAG: glycoside hydrolase family 42, partial [Roseiflexaceae bacterium]
MLILASCTPAQPDQLGGLPAITIADARLRAGEAAFEVRGVNYIHPSTADLSKCAALQFGADGNCPWDIAPISADLDRLRGLGVNTIRVFLNYYVFGG